MSVETLLPYDQELDRTVQLLTQLAQLQQLGIGIPSGREATRAQLGAKVQIGAEIAAVTGIVTSVLISGQAATAATQNPRRPTAVETFGDRSNHTSTAHIANKTLASSPKPSHSLELSKGRTAVSVTEKTALRDKQATSSIRVVWGNTLDGIDAKAHVTEAATIADNPEHPSLKTNPNLIDAGWVLQIPRAQAVAKPNTKADRLPRTTAVRQVLVTRGMTEWGEYVNVDRSVPTFADLQEVSRDSHVAQPVLHSDGAISMLLLPGEVLEFAKPIPVPQTTPGYKPTIHLPHGPTLHAPAPRTEPNEQHPPAKTEPTDPTTKPAHPHAPAKQPHSPIVHGLKPKLQTPPHTVIVPKKPRLVTPHNKPITVVHLTDEQMKIIQSEHLNAQQKQFLASQTQAVEQVVANGAKINPAITIGQDIDESGYGESVLAKYYNFFGMKAGSTWKGATVTLPTEEWEHGQYVHIMARFEAFPNATAGVQGLANFIASREWYADARANYKNPEEYLAGLENKDKPYATSPTYFRTIMNVVTSLNLIELAPLPATPKPPAAPKPAPTTPSTPATNSGSTSNGTTSGTTTPTTPGAGATTTTPASPAPSPAPSNPSASSTPTTPTPSPSPTTPSQSSPAAPTPTTPSTVSPHMQEHEQQAVPMTKGQILADEGLEESWTQRGHGPSFSDATPQYQLLMKTLHDAAAASDCAGTIKTWLDATGIDTTYPYGTMKQMAYVRNNPQEFTVYNDIADAKAATPGHTLLPGDILIMSKHTYLYVGPQPDGYDAVSASLGDHVPEPLRTYNTQDGQPFIVARLNN